MIASLGNAQIKNIKLLLDKSKVRKEQKLFVAEGIKMFLEAPVYMVEKVYVSTSFLNRTIHRSKIEKLPFEQVTDEVYQKMSDTKTPQGIMTVLKQPVYQEKDLFSMEGGRFLVLNGIQDPGNLGTMVRTGEGAGISGIVMDRNTVDIFSPKVIRATMGSIYRVPFLYTEDLCKSLVSMRNLGITLYAAHLKGEKSYTEEEYKGAVAFLIGNEGNGLSDEVAQMADIYLRIPMHGKVESLNAGVSAALFMYEADRQERNK